jgi:hypothetical protein
MQPTAQLAGKNHRPISLPSQAGAKGYIIQAFVAPAMLGAPDAQAVGWRKLNEQIILHIVLTNHNNINFMFKRT